jgi:hypothetical protein
VRLFATRSNRDMSHQAYTSLKRLFAELLEVKGFAECERRTSLKEETCSLILSGSRFTLKSCGGKDLKARMTGLEPATSGVTGRCSNQLSYIPKRYRLMTCGVFSPLEFSTFSALL